MGFPRHPDLWRGSRIAILAAAVLASQARAGMAQATSGLREAEVRYAAALTSGDIGTAATFFDKAIVLTIPGCPGIEGRGQVRSFLSGLARAGRTVSLTPEDVKQAGGDTAREVGTFRLSGSTTAAASREGRYAAGWAKVGRDWRITVTIWVLDGPPESGPCGLAGAG